MKRQQPLRRAAHRGGALIEALVAVLILAVGLLGMAGSQAVSLAQQKSADHQMAASLLAQAYGEQMRGNRDGFAAGGYTWDQRYLSGSNPAAGACDPPATCAPLEAAQADRAAWLALVRQTLPAGDAFVRASGDGQSADVWVMWRDPGSLQVVSTDAICAADAIGHLPAAQRPACLFVRVRL